MLKVSQSSDSMARQLTWAVACICWTMNHSFLQADEGRVLSASADGVDLVHHFDSPRQMEPTTVRVLLPQEQTKSERFPAVYFLPVEKQQEVRWGDPVAEVRQQKIADRYRVVCVFPTFAELPWYADHPTDSRRQHESYFLKDVVDWVDRTQPVKADADSRWLAGFSKSGWGAWTLLLRHPDLFGKAAAFDAPMMMNAPGKYGSGPLFGTPENFRRYQVTELLLQSAAVREVRPRLGLIGRGNFDSEHQQLQQFAQQQQIPLYVLDDRKREHSWSSGWLIPAMDWLSTK